MSVEINKKLLQQNLIFDLPVTYDDYITLYPIKMKDYLDFQVFQLAITARKNSIFQRKDVIKMGYWDFIKETAINPDNFQNKDLPSVSLYHSFILTMLPKICGKDADIKCNTSTLDISINGELITNEIFDDMRRIIILQNDINFDIDEFMNIDTVKALEKAREFEVKKNKETSDIEDYIDSLVIELSTTNDYVMNLTVRKFWRYIKRVNKHEQYEACLNGQMSGMATFKEPIEHWMTSIEIKDKYENLKTDEGELREKIG